MFRLYAKLPNRKRFSPMDYAKGEPVINLIHATLFSANEAAKLRGDLPQLHDMNPGWAFELRGVPMG
jgi:hypothetical protein